MKYALFLFALFALTGLNIHTSIADDEPVFQITVKDHQFQPSTLKLPAGVKVKVVIKNLGSEREGFNSFELNRDKTLPVGEETAIYLGPLDPGNYKFWSRFHKDTMKGQVIVK